MLKMDSGEKTGVLKEEQGSNQGNQDFEPQPDSATRPYLTEDQICSAPYSPASGGVPPASQFPTYDGSPRKQRQTYGEAYDLQPPRYDESVSPPPPTYREAAAPQQLFRDPMNYGYDQPQYGNQFQTTTTAVIVAQPGPQRRIIQNGTGGLDLTIPAVLACLFCCWPLGIPAIVYASKASSMRRVGDVENAQSYNKVAGVFLALSVMFGIVCYVIVFVYRNSLYGSRDSY